MALNNYAFEQLGSFIIGEAPSSPQYVAFGVSGSPINAAKNYLFDEVIRKEATWRFVGSNVQANANLSTNDANGSNLSEVGLVLGGTLGSDAYTRALSAIGDKTTAFGVDIAVQLRFSRPNE